MLAACFTLYEAPFWDGILTKRLDIHGSFLRNLITCSSVGNMFILFPAMIADSYPPIYVALVGAFFVATGYTVLYLEWVHLHGEEWKTLLIVAIYAWGVAWIYGAAFVTVISNADPKAKGRAIGSMLGFLYFANGWFTEVTEFEGNGHTTLKKSALRHEFIAITALLCAPGLFKLSTSEQKCSSDDAFLTGTSVALFCMLVLMFAQWLVTGGSGNTNLLNFWYGDVPFLYTLGYGVILLFCVIVNGKNLIRFGYSNLHQCGRGHKQSNKAVSSTSVTPPLSNIEKVNFFSGFFELPVSACQSVRASFISMVHFLVRIFNDRRYVLIFSIFAINIGTGQTMANRFTQIKSMYGKHWTMVAAEYNLVRPFGALCAGALADIIHSRTKLLFFLVAMMTIAQLLFSISSADESLKMVSFSWFPLPMEKIPLFLCAFSTGAIFTLVPIIEIESFDEEAIGRIHGTTMVGAILGQTLIYNIVSVVVSFSATLWVTFIICALSLILAKRLHDEYGSELMSKVVSENSTTPQCNCITSLLSCSPSDEVNWCAQLKFRGYSCFDWPTGASMKKDTQEERQALLNDHHDSEVSETSNGTRRREETEANSRTSSNYV